MRLLAFLFLPLALLAQAPSITGIDSLSYSSFRVLGLSTANFSSMRVAWSIPPANCSLANGVGNVVNYEQPVTNGGGTGFVQYNATGKTPHTAYSVCLEANVGGTWYSSAPKLVTTAIAPAGGSYVPRPPQEVSPTYDADINQNPVTVSTCAQFYSAFTTAVANQATSATTLQMPVGLANACSGTIYLDQVPPDVRTLGNANINGDGSMHLAAHGFQNDQTVILARKDYSGDAPGGIVQADYQGPDGRLYYVKRIDADNFWVCAQKVAAGGTPIHLTGNGTFYFVPYPRAALHWITVRTTTPDNQFAAPGTALGSLNWLPKMAYFQNSTANHNYQGHPTLAFIDSNNDPRRQSLLAKIRFIGIVFTVADDPASYTTPDPPAWPYDVVLQPTMQDIIFDRCVFMGPSLQQRKYAMLDLQGVNVAVLNSWIDKTINYFHSQSTIGIHQ